MMAATDLRSQLVLLRTHVRRRDVRAAEELLGALIAETASNGHTPALSPLRRASTGAWPPNPRARFGRH